jgi:hypothetical protein
MKKLLICLIMLASMCGADDTIKVLYGLDAARTGYNHLDTAVIIESYGGTIDTLAWWHDGDSTSGIRVLDTFVTVSGTGLHTVYLKGIYDGYPNEWYTIEKWELYRTIGTDIRGVVGYSVTLYAVDTSGTNDTVSGIPITVKDMTGTEKGYATTLTDGSVTFKLDSGSYEFSSVLGYGYIWEVDTSHIIATDTTLDSTLWGYNVNIGSPGADSLCRLYDYVHDINGNAVEGVTVTATLATTRNVRDTCNNVSLSGYQVTSVSNSSGYWYLDLIFTSCIAASSGSSATIKYNIVATYPSGTELVSQRYTVPDSTTHRMTW